MFKLWQSSDYIKPNPKIKVITPNLLPFPPKRRLDSRFPFAAMLPNQSFFMADSETSQQQRSAAIAVYRRYNRTYSVVFKHYRHRYSVPGLEIGRLL